MITIIIPKNNMTTTLSITNYKYKNWNERFTDGKVVLEDLYVHRSWKPIFDEIISENKNKWNKMNSYLSECLENGEQIFPYPELVFAGFNATPFGRSKVCMILQDPYFNEYTVGDGTFPEAMGISLSVPIGIPIPSSLQNIYKNAIKFKHMHRKPTHGNLSFWAKQGCLMINSSLTVIKKNPNIHANLWAWFTDEIIKKISRIHDNLVFVLWGAVALKKGSSIDDKHKFVISSHPSGLSCHNGFKGYPAFVDCDQFGMINKYLEEFGKDKIVWQIV